MPTSLHAEFFTNKRRAVPGGLYCFSSPESKYYRPQQSRRYKRAYKVGSTWDLGKRINSYLLSYPFSVPHGLELECVVMMNLANTQREKVAIQSAEDYAHKQLHERLGANPRHYPGYANGQRLNIARVEWYSDVNIEVIKSLFRYISTHFGTCVYAEGNENYAQKWADATKKKKLSWSYKPPRANAWRAS